MNSAIAGLIGVVIGALAAIATTFVTSLLQMRQEHRIWLRNKKQEVYSNAVKYILRMMLKCSEITAEGKTAVGVDAQKEWFDDLNEALTWVTTLSIYCSPIVRPAIIDALSSMRWAISAMVRGTPPGGKILDTLSSAYETIRVNAQFDISGDKSGRHVDKKGAFVATE